MYIFKWWHLVIPLGLVATGFGIVKYYEHRLERTWDVDVLFLILEFFGVITYPYMLEAGMKYQNYMTDTDTPQIMPHKEPEQIYPSTPLKYGELHQYAQTFPTVTERKEKQFCKTLLDMQTLADDDSKVDLREDTWKDHFGSRDNYVEVRTRFELAKAFARKDARLNSPFIVTDWRKVQLVAQGEKIK